MSAAKLRFALWPLIAFLIAGLVCPLMVLLWYSLSDATGQFAGFANFTAYFSSPGLLKALWHTLAVGMATAVLALLAGFILAYGLTCASLYGKAGIRILFMAPLFAPSILPAMGCIYLFGRQGIVLPLDIYGPTGIILGFTILALPQATLQIALVLQQLDTRQVQAARTLGAAALRRFFTIVLPHTRHGLIRAGSVAFVLATTDFGVPAVLGGDYSMLATEIYKQAIGQHDFSMGAVASLTLMLPALAVFALDRSARRPSASSGASSLLPPPRCLVRDITLTILCWILVLALLAVLGAVVWGSFIAFWPYDFSLTLDNYSFGNSVYGLTPFYNSLLLACLVSGAGTALIFCGACLATRGSGGRGKRLYNLLAIMPICLPGTVLGLAYILTYGSFDIGSSRAGGFFLLTINTIIHLYTVPHLSCTSVLEQLDRRYEAVGCTLGVPVRITFWRVICPLSATALLETVFYLFCSTLTTISAVIFLYSPETIPAAITALQLLDSGKLSEGSAMATVLLGIACAGRILLFCISPKKGKL